MLTFNLLNIFSIELFDVDGDPDSICLGEEPPSSKYIIGTFNNYRVEVDPLMRWNDIRVLDSNGKELLDLSNHDLTANDLI